MMIVIISIITKLTMMKKIPLINFTATEQQYLLIDGAVSASDQ